MFWLEGSTRSITTYDANSNILNNLNISIENCRDIIAYRCYIIQTLCNVSVCLVTRYNFITHFV